MSGGCLRHRNMGNLTWACARIAANAAVLDALDFSNEQDFEDATLNLTHGLFIQMLTGKAGLKDLLLSDELELEGSKLDLVKFFSLFDKPEGRFDIVTP